MEEQSSSHFSVIGHEAIVNFLRGGVKNNRLAHAYIFLGADSVGRRPMASFFASLLLCTAKEKPCGVCGACSAVKKNIHPDVFRLARLPESKEIKVDQVRELIARLSLSSFLSGYKIAIIDNAEDMNRETANALLKTLEEPTSKTILVLIAKSLSALPETIVSRSQVISFTPVAKKVIESTLVAQGASREQAETLAFLANGAPGKALRIFHHPEALQEYKENMKIFLDVANARDVAGRFASFESILKEKKSKKAPVKNLHVIVECFERALRDMLCFRYGSPDLVINDMYRAELELLSDRWSTKDLVAAFAFLRRSETLLRENVNPKLIFENFALMF